MRVARTLLGGAGLASPRPDRIARALAVLHRWGLTPPAAYGVAASLYPDRAAIIDERGALTFADVERHTNALARWLRRAGVEMGDTVAIMCRNHRGFVEATVACLKLGANVLYLDTGWEASQLIELIRREDPAAVIYDEEFSTQLRGWRSERLRRVVAWREWHEAPRDPSMDELIAAESTARLTQPNRRGSVMLPACWTVPIPRGMSRDLPSSLLLGTTLTSEMPLRKHETTMIAVPLFHPWGFLHLTLALRLASTIVLRRGFDAEQSLRTVARYSASALVVLPSLLEGIVAMSAETLERCELDCLGVIAVSDAKLPGEPGIPALKMFGTVLYNLRRAAEVRFDGCYGEQELQAL
jgi:acyl-CoA synthetase (AMP-forming)/AMP-acid ligase II